MGLVKVVIPTGQQEVFKVKLAKISLVFILLMAIDAVISFIAINSGIAYELNPIYHSLGHNFWAFKVLGAWRWWALPHD